MERGRDGSNLAERPEFTGLPHRDSPEGRSLALELEECFRINSRQQGEGAQGMVYLPPTLLEEMGGMSSPALTALIFLCAARYPRHAAGAAATEAEVADGIGLSTLRSRRVLEALAADGWVSQRAVGTWGLFCDSTG